MSLRELSLEDIELLAVGAWVLGTGGGGNPYLPLLNMRALYRDGHRVQLMDAADLADDDWVGTVANMGAPLVGQERLTDSLTLARAVSVMEKHIGHRFAALMSMEIGGANGVRPFMAAAHLKRPVVDSDTMGRAYPEAQMTSVSVGGLTPYPLTAVDVRGFESIVHKVPTWKWAERVARKICVEYGSVAATCQPPRTGAEVKQWGIHGTDHQGHGDRPAPCARPSASTTIPSRPSCRSSPASFCTRARSSTSRAAPPKAFCGASCASMASTPGVARP